MSSSHYAVVEFQHAGKNQEAPSSLTDAAAAAAAAAPAVTGAPSSSSLTTTAVWARDIVDLSIPAPVLADDLFHPAIAKVNRLLLGMRAFGTGIRADAAGPGYRLWPLYTGISSALVMAPVFYCLGLSWTAAGMSAGFSFLPMMIGSNRDERNMMGSKMLGHRITRLLRENEKKATEELAKVRGFCVLLPDWLFGTVFFTLLFVLPYVLIVTPMATALPDDTGLQSMWLVGAVSLSMLGLCFSTVFYFFNAWTPLMELYTRELTDQSEAVVTRIMKILDSPALSPQDARERLGVLHDRVLEPLREDFRGTLEPYMRSSSVVFLMMLIPAVTMAVSTVDVERSEIVVGDAGATAMRFAYAGALAVIAPLYMRMLLRTLAAPWRSWRRLEKRLRHAGMYARAVEKFGGGDVFEQWLERNSLAVCLFGVPVDDDLGGKVAGLTASLVGGVVLYLSRMLFV